MRNSFSMFDGLFDNYPFLNRIAINDYQLFTVFWNVFLALLPLFFYALLKFVRRKTGFAGLSRKIAGIAIFAFWLLFLPNSAYIITDVRHLLNYCPADSLNQVCAANAWMIMVFFAYSSFGWVCFYYSLKTMSEFVHEIFAKLRADIFAAMVIPAVSLGVLVGLLNRFNSWDVFVFPFWLARVFASYFLNQNYLIDWLVFTAFLYLLYFAGDAVFKKIKI